MKVLSDVLVIHFPASHPIAVLPAPVVTFLSAQSPNAVFDDPVVLQIKASSPKAVLVAIDPAPKFVTSTVEILSAPVVPAASFTTCKEEVIPVPTCSAPVAPATAAAMVMSVPSEFRACRALSVPA